jgi:hypothetical protein
MNNQRWFGTIQEAKSSRRCVNRGCNAKIGSRIVRLSNQPGLGGGIIGTFREIGAICEDCWKKQQAKEVLYYTDTGEVTQLIRKGAS